MNIMWSVEMQYSQMHDGRFPLFFNFVLKFLF